MTARITARRTRAISDGWEYYQEGQFGAAIRQFKAAEACDRTDPEAALGIIASSVAHHNNASAQTALSRAITRAPGLFELEIDLHDKHPEPQVLAEYVATLGLVVRKNPDDDSFAGMHAFLLWFTGQQTEALLVADRIYEEHRSSPYAAMAARMRGEELPEQDSVAGQGASATAPMPNPFDPSESGL